jgi:hypothetical protein
MLISGPIYWVESKSFLPKAGVRCLESATEGKQSEAERRTDRQGAWKGSTPQVAFATCGDTPT